MKLMGWQDVVRDPAWTEGRVLDVRAAAAFTAGHPRGACSRPLAAGDDTAAALPACALPPRRERLLVSGDEAAAVTAAVEHLRARGHEQVRGAVLTAVGTPAAAWETGPSDRVLWRPPAYLERMAAHLPVPELGPAVDLGCGSGRAAVWLARRGHAVVGVDVLPDALALGRRLAAESGVRCSWLQADLSVSAEVPCGPWALALAVRYLERPLLRRLPELLLPGGVALVHTFRVDRQDEGPPRRVHRLADGELEALFPVERWEVLDQVEERDPDGRAVAGLCARLRH
jgi:hypothetical protein